MQDLRETYLFLNIVCICGVRTLLDTLERVQRRATKLVPEFLNFHMRLDSENLIQKPSRFLGWVLQNRPIKTVIILKQKGTP